MTDETIDAVAQAPGSQEVVEPAHDHNPDTNPVAEVQNIPEDPQKGQWRELREALKELKRENQQLREHLTQPAKKDAEADVDDSEPYVTPQALKKKMAALEAKLAAKETESADDRLRTKFADFDAVVSVENIDQLKTNDPELFLSLKALASDRYAQGVAAYKMLKRSNYQTDVQSMQDRQKVADNQKKPASVQAVRKTGALSDANKFANGLTPELKKALWAEMQTARKAS